MCFIFWYTSFIYPNNFLTTSFILFPSAVAPISDFASFITIPKSFIVVAPTLLIISLILDSNSSSVNCFGKYSSNTLISSFT